MFSALGAGERMYELGTQGGAKGVDARLAEDWSAFLKNALWGCRFLLINSGTSR